MASGPWPFESTAVPDSDQNTHCIGDRANHIVLNAIESIIGDSDPALTERMFRLEHAQIMTQEDLKRAARLGGRRKLFARVTRLRDVLVIASYQPTHVTSDVGLVREHGIAELISLRCGMRRTDLYVVGVFK